jgi:hypothetical protein
MFGVDPSDHRLGLRDIVGLAWRQQELHRVSGAIARRMKFATEASDRATEMLVFAAFFEASAGWRGGRMIVASTINHSRSRFCKASKTRCHTPCRDQRGPLRRVQPHAAQLCGSGQVNPSCYFTLPQLFGRVADTTKPSDYAYVNFAPENNNHSKCYLRNALCRCSSVFWGSIPTMPLPN